MLIYFDMDTQHAHFSSFFSSFLTVYLLSVILWLDKGDFPEDHHFYYTRIKTLGSCLFYRGSLGQCISLAHEP